MPLHSGRPSQIKAAFVTEGRFAFSGFNFYGLVVNPVGAAGFVVVVAGAGVGWFGLAWA